MRILLSRTNVIGDLVVALPIQKYILDNDPSSQIFWLVLPEAAPVLKHMPGVSGVFICYPSLMTFPYQKIFNYIKPDVLLNLHHLNQWAIPAAKKAGIPIRVAAIADGYYKKPRNLHHGLRQLFDATHIIWSKRRKSGRHESLHVLDFLQPLGWAVPKSIPDTLSPVLTAEEIDHGKAGLQNYLSPRLGVVLRGSGGGAYPSLLWWEKMLEALRRVGWNPVILSPPEESHLPPTDIRGLMARLSACDAVLGVSTGPTHLAAALNVPTLCLMGKRKDHGPDRWAPLGSCVETLQYLGEEDDFGSGMDRLSVDSVLAIMEKMR
ncbi:MAG: hypothetical protein FWG12_00130 [Holophagaceae bacterium]|nr:hypothetical protein [Holophagaceae bacterium]